MRERVLFALVCLAVLAGSAAVAESHEEAAPAAPTLRPIELFACHFNEGRTMADLGEVTAAWNAWMDENGRDEYWASMLIPVYHSAEIDFDIGWVGGWPDGKTMAASTEFWINKGGEHQAAFDRVVDCPIHLNFAVYTVQPNPIPFQPGPVEFSNCTLEEGAEMTAAIGAVHQWVEHEGEDRGHYLLFPAFGEASDSEYNFKWVAASSYAALGAGWDDYAGGGWRKAQELFDGLLDCDSPRVYHGVNVRKVDLGAPAE